MRLRLHQSHTGRPGESFWIFSRLGTPPMVLCMSSLAPIVSTLECSELHHGSISYSDTTHCGCSTLFNNACILGQYSTIFSLHIRKAMITILQICACGFCAISLAPRRRGLPIKKPTARIFETGSATADPKERLQLKMRPLLLLCAAVLVLGVSASQSMPAAGDAINYGTAQLMEFTNMSKISPACGFFSAILHR